MNEVSETVSESHRRRPKSETKFPAYALNEALAVPDVIHRKGGGTATEDQLAAYLGHKSPKNGSFAAKISAAKMFGLIENRGAEYRLSARAKKALMPEFEDDRRQALVEAFLAVPLFKAVYDEYRGAELPEGLGLKNALRNKFHVVPGRLDVAQRTLMTSAEQAGFFNVRGSRTQMIVPPIGKVRPDPDSSGGRAPSEENADGSFGGGGGGDSGDGGTTPSARNKEELQNEYISLLLDVLREKLKNGETDSSLMEKIERLVGLEP
jgi:hypothetical protein